MLLNTGRAHHKTHGTKPKKAANTHAKTWLGKHPLCLSRKSSCRHANKNVARALHQNRSAGMKTIHGAVNVTMPTTELPGASGPDTEQGGGLLAPTAHRVSRQELFCSCLRNDT